jgi:hypothetical protein
MNASNKRQMCNIFNQDHLLVYDLFNDFILNDFEGLIYYYLIILRIKTIITKI